MANRALNYKFVSEFIDSLYTRRFDYLPLVRLRLMMSRQDPDKFSVSRGYTRICIEGYPRSANSFAVRMFRLANDLPIAHHTHATANVRAAILYGIPTILLIRNPIDAIVSKCIFDTKYSLGRHFLDYIHLYRYAMKVQDRLVFARFETVKTDFGRVIDAVNSHFGTTFTTIRDHALAATQVVKDIKNRYALSSKLSSVRKERIPLPTDERKRQRQILLSLVRAHPTAPEAISLYLDIIKNTKNII